MSVVFQPEIVGFVRAKSAPRIVSTADTLITISVRKMMQKRSISEIGLSQRKTSVVAADLRNFNWLNDP